MTINRKVGRRREVDEIVNLRRAALVGQLLLGELNGPLPPVSPESFNALPRAEIKAQRKHLRATLKGQIAKFCNENFESLTPKDLVRLYLPIFEKKSSFRIPLVEFEKTFGKPTPRALRGVPRHATVQISPWGLQMEFPELHFAKDLACAHNSAFELKKELDAVGTPPWQVVKTSAVRSKLATIVRALEFHKRMTLIACFNLVEAYVNGLAWEYCYTHDLSSMSDRDRKLLTEQKNPVALDKKLTQYPHIVAGTKNGPLYKERDPLKTFLETVRPFRDAIVHSSPFSAAERFGGYDRLNRIYELNMDTLFLAVGKTIELIGEIHRFVGGSGRTPSGCRC